MNRGLGLLFCLCVAISSLASIQSPDFAGTWAGAMATTVGPGGLEITLRRDGEGWKASAKVRIEGDEVAPPVEQLTVAGGNISFALTLDRTLVKFDGKVEGEKLNGSLTAFAGERKIGDGTFTLTRGGQMPAVQPQQGGQVADPNFDTKIASPAYPKKKHPRVLFDEAHNNFHTASGRYKPFADLITNDGYVVTPNKQKFSAAVLKGYDLLVISNALGAARMNVPAASNPAFTDAESDAVRDWVKGGGALLLIADHAPMGSANQILADRFGVNMSKMFTVDEQNYDRASENPGFIIYTRESGRLADHAITRGRNQAERVNKVIAFTGQSLKGPGDSFAFLRLADTAVDRMPGANQNPVPAAGRAQGIALSFGKGRAVFLGEAAMLTAQITGPERMPFGMNRPGLDNRQLALNIVHWLSRLLK